jgi:hypothetical protein
MMTLGELMRVCATMKKLRLGTRRHWDPVQDLRRWVETHRENEGEPEPDLAVIKHGERGGELIHVFYRPTNLSPSRGVPVPDSQSRSSWKIEELCDIGGGSLVAKWAGGYHRRSNSMTQWIPTWQRHRHKHRETKLLMQLAWRRQTTMF